MSSFFVYILRCADDTLYTGYTNNLEERLETHNGNTKKIGAKYTRGRRPVTLFYSEACDTKSIAMKREYEIKQLSRKGKERLRNVS